MLRLILEDSNEFLKKVKFVFVVLYVAVLGPMAGYYFNKTSEVSSVTVYPNLGIGKDSGTFVRASADGNYHPMYFSEDDLYYMTEALYFEAATETAECQALVAEVILNRKSDNRWGGSVHSVIWEKYQFSYTHDGKPETMLDLDARKRIEKVAISVLGGNVVDKSGGAMYYYNPKLANPNWDWDKIELVVSCGDHDFYRDKQQYKDF